MSSLKEAGYYIKTEPSRVWIESGHEDGQRQALRLLEIAAGASGGGLLHCAAPRDGFRAYGALSKLLEALKPVVDQESPPLLERYRVDLERVCPFLMGGAPTDSTPSGVVSGGSLSADAVAYAIVRRISRESAGESVHIDGVARFLVEAKRSCPSLAGPLFIALTDSEWCDRPSLRVLYRAQRISDREDGLSWHFLFNSVPLEPEGDVHPVKGVASRLQAVRATFFRRMAEELQVPCLRLGAPAAPANFLAPAGEEPPATLVEVAENLVRHNYERVYYLCAQALPGRAGQQRADLLRLLALADANLGEYESAEQVLREALQYAEQPTFRAHLYYLIGLLYTKRFYQLDRAEEAYRQGLACLEGAPEEDVQVRVERSWLINGISLANTLLAKSMPANQRMEMLEQICREEIAAYQMVAHIEDSACQYLRFNLLSNIAFLLEIQERYEHAINFWERAFDRYVRDSSEAGRGFQKIFFYRKGMILQRNNQVERALALLQQAWALAEEDGDRFVAERISYGIAYAHLETGEYEQALSWFSTGLERAWINQEKSYALEQVTGVLEAAAALGDADTVAKGLAIGAAISGAPRWQELYRAYPAMRPQSDLRGWLSAAGIRAPKPAPKLPAYIPSVDLESRSRVDLNRYLVSDDAQPLGAMVGAAGGRSRA